MIIDQGGEMAPVSLTVSAATRLRPLLRTEAQGQPALRVAVEPGGFSGMRYEVAFDGVPATTDIVVESHGIDIIVDPTSEGYLRGAVIDFGAAGFWIYNPNSRGACACGASFAPIPTH
jgi:iron-sulfur cluster assembly accessory protein